MKKYTKTHEWIEVNGDEAKVGITSHAAEELGDITFVEPPPKTTDMIVGDKVGVIESVKAASDIYAPASGTVIAVNKKLEDDPGLINRSPEDEGWIFKINNIDLEEIDKLMSKQEYDKLLASKDKK
ncbi:MAG TPA: glycine cleavage system protein GcvH [Victivallales bacterium]|nr:glycine cleavage system protein GcvH [Victivallales bacterium]HPO91261.1 glycine cleavage system protein GcvH [Victivallales bacterium]HRR06274.1 glycine cleavage system protein GcvH [Victivallales bacterium]